MSDENTVVSGNTDTTILTEETFERLKSMLESKDEGNHKMAQLIINQLDVRANIYDIWRLAKNNASKMVNLRTKASRAFRDECNLFGLCYANVREFAVWLESKGWLNPELYQRLCLPIKKHINKNHSHPFYEFSIEIKPEYKHLDPSDQLTKLKKYEGQNKNMRQDRETESE